MKHNNTSTTALSQKVVLVTGASRGIGESIAMGFAKEGAHVVVNFLKNEEKANEVVKACQALGSDALAYQADVGDLQACHKMIEHTVHEFGQIDILVNNAFAPFSFDPDGRKPFWEIPLESFEKQWSGALGALFNTTQAALPYFRSQGKGSIVSIGSNLVHRPVVPYHDYISAKSAMISLTKTLGVELAPLGVRVNAVCPGWVYPTDSSRSSKELARHSLEVQTPMGRLASPQDVVGPVLFLASEWSSFMTGQVLYVDGGYTMPNA
jgi:3-oxoacyl-[acyl-carrier protein] reductase